MPKMKTNRAAAKRFRVTGKGKIKCGRACASHMLRGKSARRLRKLSKNDIVDHANAKVMKRLLPNSF